MVEDDEDDNDQHGDGPWENWPSLGSIGSVLILESEESGFRDDDISHRPPPPPLPSSPSVASFSDDDAVSPLRRELSRTTLNDDDDGDDDAGSLPAVPSSSRLALARRLSQLAQQLTDGDDDDEIDELAISAQVGQMEKSLARPGRTHGLPPKRMDQLAKDGEGLVLSSHHSEFTPSTQIHDPKSNPSRIKSHSQDSLTPLQANQFIEEANKLNDELTTIVTNLKARQEESDHIRDLLIERAERAAQRIIALQSRASRLEAELAQNDDELQSLRICLKAVEIRVPPHPDPVVRQCISSFKEDYARLRRRRAGRGEAGWGDEGDGSVSLGAGVE